MTAPPATRKRRQVAAALSVIAPGSGHAILGRPLRGLVLVLVLIAAAFAIRFFGGPALGLVVVLWLVMIPLDARFFMRRAVMPSDRTALLTAIPFLVVPVAAKLGGETYKIPSGAMFPAMATGDQVFGWKLWGVPDRGDVVVFEWPQDDRKDFVMRVIGLPGDHVTIRNGVLAINGTAAEYGEPRPCQAMDIDDHDGRWQKVDATCLEERFGGRGWTVARAGKDADTDTVVPADAYFFLGDFRSHSFDSRFWGTVPATNLKDVVKLIYWSAGPDGTRWERIGNAVR